MTLQLEQAAMGPQHIHELHREISGAMTPAVARYALEHEVTFDRGLQEYSRGVIGADADQFNGLGSTRQQVLVHSALNRPEVTSMSSDYSTADVNARPEVIANGAQYSGPEGWRSSARRAMDAVTEIPGQRPQITEQEQAAPADRPLTLGERARALRRHSGARPFADGDMDAHVRQNAAAMAAATEKAMADPAAAVRNRLEVN